MLHPGTLIFHYEVYKSLIKGYIKIIFCKLLMPYSFHLGTNILLKNKIYIIIFWLVILA